MLLQNLKSVALPVPEIIGGTQKIWAVPSYAHAPFSPKFLIRKFHFNSIFNFLIRIGPINVPAKFEVRCLTRS